MDHYYRGEEGGETTNNNNIYPPPPAPYGAVSMPMQPAMHFSDNGDSENPTIVMIKNSRPPNLPPPSMEVDYLGRGVWSRLDPQNLGRISVQRLRQQMLHVKPSVSHLMPCAVRDTLMLHADVNHDGYLEYGEFLRLARAGEDPDSQLNTFRRILALVAYANLPQTRRPKVVDSYLSQYCFPPPMFMLTISAIEIAFYVYCSTCMQPNGFGMNGPVPTSSPLIFNPYRRYEAWRYFTYIFIHVGWFHLLTNVLVQLVVGVPLELVHKFWRLAVIYVAGVAAGALGTSLTDPCVFLAGASSGVYALMTAHLANIIINWREMECVVVRLVFWVTLFTADVTYAVYNRFFVNSSAKVSYSAHFFGALMGVLVGMVLLRNWKRHLFEKVLVWICAVLTVAVFAFMVVCSVVNEDWFPKNDCSELLWPGVDNEP